MKEINNSIKSLYGIDLMNISNYREGHIGLKSDGKIYIKKMPYSKERINFIHEVKEYIINNGFKNIDKYYISNENTPYFNVNDSLYVVNDIFSGRECNFENREDMLNAVATLAKLHKASVGFNSNQDYVKNELGKLPETLNKRFTDLKKMKKAATKRNSQFDYVFLENCDNFMELAQEAIQQLGTDTYLNLIKQNEKEPIICHHDYSYNNIIFNNNNCYVTNFDQCCVDLKVYDIANIIRRKMRKSGWDIKEAIGMIEKYDREFKITEDELYILVIMLKFPQKLWRVANKYYNSKHVWADKFCINKFDELIKEKDHHRNFIRLFEKEVLK